ncbi:hypothetical protein [Streptomyces sp. SID8352]|uniref:hypothetical protein n=1 Tax=Streptomyces sp. SID8352 TaxID=2690338 RepID=UPI001368C7CD|nr:hypothetical protein [Streptomyces sp. SID8352]MYU20793.1 hypothetical protein [Streptomyces sp. SID8352]
MLSSTTSAPLIGLPPEGMKALARLAQHFPLIQAATRYETAARRAAELAGLAKSGRLSDLDADSLAAAEDLMASAHTTLDQAGRLDLIEVRS